MRQITDRPRPVEHRRACRARWSRGAMPWCASTNGKLQLENVGLNSCIVGDEEVLGGQTAVFEPGTKVRIWPFTLTFEAEKAATDHPRRTRSPSPRDHGRSGTADPPQAARTARPVRVRGQPRPAMPQSILLLENNIEDVCRELDVFGPDNEPLLEEITGLTLRDHLINQLIMETGTEEYFDLAALTSQRVRRAGHAGARARGRAARPAAVRPRAAEPARVPRHQPADRTGSKSSFNEFFHLVRPHLHHELRKYLILRTLKKDLKDTIFGFGPLQDLLRAPTVTEIMVVGSDQIYVEQDGRDRAFRAAVHLRQGDRVDHRADRRAGRPADRQEPAAGRRPPARRLARQRDHSAAGRQGAAA